MRPLAAPLGLADPFGEPAVDRGRLVWTVDLPGDAASADARLDRAEAWLTAEGAALDAASARLDSAVEQAQRPVRHAFDLGADVTPEIELADAVRRPRSGRTAFALGEDAGPDETVGVEQASALYRAIRARLDGLLDVARNAAVVETRLDARLIAVSTLGWMGGARTFTARGLEDDALERHTRTVELVARIRRRRLSFVVFVVTGAARIAAATSAGQVTALPAIYRFIQRVIAGFDDLRAAEAAPATQGGTP